MNRQPRQTRRHAPAQGERRIGDVMKQLLAMYPNLKAAPRPSNSGQDQTRQLPLHFDEHDASSGAPLDAARPFASAV